MPLLDGPLFEQLVIAFATIALLALVLRWTFSSDLRQANRPGQPRSEPNDFGLLAIVAAVDSPDEASRIRERLAVADIRATTTVGGDSRHLVLVFAADLDRARRVCGGPSPS